MKTEENNGNGRWLLTLCSGFLPFLHLTWDGERRSHRIPGGMPLQKILHRESLLRIPVHPVWWRRSEWEVWQGKHKDQRPGKNEHQTVPSLYSPHLSWGDRSNPIPCRGASNQHMTCTWNCLCISVAMWQGLSSYLLVKWGLWGGAIWLTWVRGRRSRPVQGAAHAPSMSTSPAEEWSRWKRAALVCWTRRD